MKILVTLPESDYELIDSGEGEKLERYGTFKLVRPDPQVLWLKKLPAQEWAKADGAFSRIGKTGGWKLTPGLPQKWNIIFAGLKFAIKPSAFKHTGLFPEQKENWKWLAEALSAAALLQPDRVPVQVLNLFGYTGGASLAAAVAGAEVCHVDGSKSAVSWARENAELSGLVDKPIRWIVDDARAFLKREIKRGHFYDGIILDPPTFGHGPEGELWKIEKDFLELLDLCKQVLSKEPVFVLINGYAAGYSAIAYKNALESIVPAGAEIEAGELTIEETGSKRLLPAGIFARWKK